MVESNNIAKFGTAGMPPNFSKAPFNGKTEQFFGWLLDNGLNAYEMQCTYGFKTALSVDQIARAKRDGIYISIHGPYFINLGSKHQSVQANSRQMLIEGIDFAKKYGINRIIFHPGGGYGKTDEERKAGLQAVINNMREVVVNADMGDVKLYPEIGGKVANLGSLDEIIEICHLVPNTYPCIDVAHLHARENGSLNTMQDFVSVFDKIENSLGRDALENMHVHCYTIEYNDKGEIKHRVHDDNDASFLDNFIAACHEKKLKPWVISEALDSQDMGAKYLKRKYYE